jgi:hypothetical protein
MRNKTSHSYQLVNIFGGHSTTNNKWKGAPMVTIQFKNLDTNAELETYIVVPGTYKDGMRDCKGFANFRNWESIIRYFDEYKKYIYRFDPEITDKRTGQQAPFITKKNDKVYIINADAKPYLTDNLVNDYDPPKPVSHAVIQEQINTVFASLFDAEDIIEVEPGKFVIERKL